jgi:hypothetical protein
LLGENASRYGVAVLDLSDPERPRYAEHRGDYLQNAGSVGKLGVALGLFQALADAWPDDLDRRIRYASAPALKDSAVYFKSGSLYSCSEEEVFSCGKYMGNNKNYMNSVAIVESPAGEHQLHYMASVISNILRKNRPSTIRPWLPASID